MTMAFPARRLSQPGRQDRVLAVETLPAGKIRRGDASHPFRWLAIDRNSSSLAHRFIETIGAVDGCSGLSQLPVTNPVWKMGYSPLQKR
jgi:hypothetical protein